MRTRRSDRCEIRWHLDRVPGGSSGGSAAAVAQGTAVVSLGSDTGGSIRQPASFCGVVGVTPTYGRVSRYGLMAFASSLDHIGPFARNVQDAATLLQAIAGRDPMDATSAAAPVPDYTAALDGNVRGMRIGLPKEYFKGLASETGDLITNGVELLQEARLRGAGSQPAHHRLRDCLLLHHLYSGGEFESRALRRRALHDAFANRRHADRHVPQHARRRLRSGMQAPHHAGHVRAERRLLRCLLPEGAESARAHRAGFREGVRGSGCASLLRYRRSRRSGSARSSHDPMEMYLSDIYTITGDLAGIPCMSVPCGNTAAGLPVGMQILTQHFDEAGCSSWRTHLSGAAERSKMANAADRGIRIQYDSDRQIRVRNKLYYRFNHWPIWITVFFLVPGSLTFDLFERGFDWRMALWLGCVLVGTGVAGLRGRLPTPGCSVHHPVHEISRIHCTGVICYTFAWGAVISYAAVNITGLVVAIVTGNGC